MNSNYLKYWRVRRYFIKAKYKLTQAELDVLLFLHDEKYFSKEKFEEFNNLLSWDVNRFDKHFKLFLFVNQLFSFEVDLISSYVT